MDAPGAARRPAPCPAGDARRPFLGRPDAGEVEFLYEVVNQEGAVAMTQRAVLRLRRRGGAEAR